MKRLIVTKRQMAIMQELEKLNILFRPRNTLERLAKKGLVYGDRRVGWRLTTAGKNWIKEKGH